MGVTSLEVSRGLKAMERVVAKVGVTNATPHDFRRTDRARPHGRAPGHYAVHRLAGPNQISDTGGAAPVTGVYDRNEYLAEKRRALEAWALVVAEIAEGKSQNSNVVALGRRKSSRTK